MTPAQIHLHVDIERDQEPITGTITDAAGAALEFAGWMELMSAFDTARDRARDTPRDPPSGSREPRPRAPQ